MKVLVMGATGMAGSTISLYLTQRGHDVTAFSTTAVAYCKGIVGNALDSKLLTDILENNNYDYVINCIGILNQFAESNRAQAVYLNSYLPHQIVDIIQNMPTRLIHMSTNCVFSGKTGGYTETSLRDGETFYDRSKALGEVVDSKNLTFRTSLIGPDIDPNGIGLLNWFMQQSGTLSGYTGAIWNGVTTLILAKATEQAMHENLTGLYNLVNDTVINKYEMLGLFNKHFKDNAVEIIPQNIISVDKSLINTRTDFSFTVPSYEQMIIEMKEWIYANKALYPHYFRG